MTFRPPSGLRDSASPRKETRYLLLFSECLPNLESTSAPGEALTNWNLVCQVMFIFRALSY